MGEKDGGEAEKRLRGEAPIQDSTGAYFAEDELDKTKIRIVDDAPLEQQPIKPIETDQSIQEPTSNPITSKDQTDHPLLGTNLEGQIILKELLGEGGMSTVFRGYHSQIGRNVAVKVMNPRLVTDRNSLLRFNQEARAAGRLDHANIVTVHDFRASEQGPFYLVMDYVEGTSLDRALKEEGPIEPDQAIPIFLQACDALQHAHKQGIIHRDLKPSNLMLTVTGEGEQKVKLLDFGIAKIHNPEGDPLQKLTQTGEIFGSPYYMSPEQCLGKQVDSRSDIYSMGCVMFECLTGEPPLAGANAMETFFKHTTDMPPPIETRKKGLAHAREFDAIILKAMAKNPQDRYQTMQELAKDLELVGTEIGHGLIDAARDEVELALRRQRAGKASQLFKSRTFRIAALTAALAVVCLIAVNWNTPQSGSWRDLYIAGQQSFDAGDYSKATSFFRSALEKASGDAARRRAVLIELVDLDHARGREAAAQYVEELDQRKDTRSLEEKLHRLSAQCRTIEKKSNALRLADQINDCLIQIYYMKSTRSKRESQLAIENLTAAKELLERVAATDSVEYGRTLHNRAHSYYLLQDYEAAQKDFRAAVSVRKEVLSEDPSSLDSLLKSLEWLSRTYVCLNSPAQAEETLIQREKFSRKASRVQARTSRVAETKAMLAELTFFHLDQAERALDMVQDSIRGYKSHYHPSVRAKERLAEALALRGLINQSMGKLSSATEDLEQAIGMFETLPGRKSHLWLRAVVGYADTSRAKQDLKRAEALYRRALAISMRFTPEKQDLTDYVFEQLEQVKKARNAAIGLRDTAEVASSIMDLEKLKLEIDRTRYGAKSKRVARDLQDMAGHARQMKDERKASSYLNEACELARAGGHDWLLVTLLKEKFRLALDAGNKKVNQGKWMADFKRQVEATNLSEVDKKRIAEDFESELNKRNQVLNRRNQRQQ